jgi:hypothetical protein
VCSDSLHDKEVCVQDNEKRKEVAEHCVNDNIALVHDVLAQVVSAAYGHIAFGSVPLIKIQYMILIMKFIHSFNGLI